jgi:ketosteroid isomerase-like protein
MTDANEDLLARNTVFDRAVQDRDHDAAEDVLHPDYALVLVHPAPARMPRERWLAVLDDYVVHSWDLREQQVDVRGDVGSILSMVQMAATVLGEDRSGLFAITDTWLRDRDTWRVWRRHSSPLSAGRMPGAD